MHGEKKPIAVTVAETDAAIAANRAMADAEAEAEKRQLDETVEGGRYKVGDDFVDADGKPVKGK